MVATIVAISAVGRPRPSASPCRTETVDPMHPGDPAGPGVTGGTPARFGAVNVMVSIFGRKNAGFFLGGVFFLKGWV